MSIVFRFTTWFDDAELNAAKNGNCLKEYNYTCVFHAEINLSRQCTFNANLISADPLSRVANYVQLISSSFLLSTKYLSNAIYCTCFWNCSYVYLCLRQLNFIRDKIVHWLKFFKMSFSVHSFTGHKHSYSCKCGINVNAERPAKQETKPRVIGDASDNPWLCWDATFRKTQWVDEKGNGAFQINPPEIVSKLGKQSIFC